MTLEAPGATQPTATTSASAPAAAPHPLPAAAPAATAPHGTIQAHAPGAGHAGPPGPILTEAEKAALEKERALQEKLEKRAAIVVTVLRKFITNFYAARQQMLAEARAAELAKKARKGKKGKKSKKSKEEAGKDKKDAKGKDGKKKVTKTPVQEAWSSFLSDMDDRISKQKRVNLEDVFRGVGRLEPREAAALAALLATTTNKILPLDGLNITQLNLREALMAASAAKQLPVERAVPEAGSCPGLQLMQERGAPPAAILGAGFRPADVLRVGYAPHEVVVAAQHDLAGLHAAGVSVQGCLTAPGAPGLSAKLQEGPKGVAELRAAGYTLPEVMTGGITSPWDLARGGFTLEELVDAGYSTQELRAAGFGAMEAQPPALLARSMATLMLDTDARTIPAHLEGAQNLPWLQSAMQVHQQAHAQRAADGGRSVRGSLAVQGGGSLLRASHATALRPSSPATAAGSAVGTPTAGQGGAAMQPALAGIGRG